MKKLYRRVITIKLLLVARQTDTTDPMYTWLFTLLLPGYTVTNHLHSVYALYRFLFTALLSCSETFYRLLTLRFIIPSPYGM